MAVKTGEIFNSLVFGGVNSADYGIYITGEGVFNAPKRAVNMVAVPGRNGSIAIDQGHWDNIEVTYPAGTFGMDEEEFRTALSDFRNAIASQVGYQRLTDTYHPDEYRMAIYSDGLEVEPTTYNKAGEFELKFNCKPQRWLTSGEIPVTIGEWGATKTASGEIVTIESEGREAAKSLEVSLEPIQDLNGYDSPWVGGAGKNLFDYEAVSDLAGFSNNDGVFTNTHTDRRTDFRFAVQWVNGNTVVGTSAGSGAIGRQSIVCDITDAITLLRIKHSGSSLDVRFDYPFTRTGTFVVSLTVTANNPSVVGGLSVKDVMIEQGSTATSYEPYSNICPISGRTEVVTQRTGKNLLPSDAFSVDGYVKVDGSISVPSATNIEKATDFLKIVSGTDYIFSVKIANADTKWIGIGIYDADKNFIKRVSGIKGTVETTTQALSATDTENAKYVRISLRTFGLTIEDAQLELGSTATDYESYNGQTYTTALGQTVYGGRLDVVSGTLVVDRAMVDLGTLTWQAYGATASYDRYITTGIDSTVKEGTVGVCSHLLGSRSFAVGNIVISSGSSKLTAFTTKGQYASASDFKTAMSGATFVYELATPQTYQLTPQQIELLLGENHVWSDGAITMQYGDDPNSLWNPTRYDAGPIVSAEGYGVIRFNGYEIDLEDTSFGDILLHNVYQSHNAMQKLTVPFDRGFYRAGDLIKIYGLKIRSTVSPVSGRSFSRVTMQYNADSPSTDPTLTSGVSSDGSAYFQMAWDTISFDVDSTSTLEYVTDQSIDVFGETLTLTDAGRKQTIIKTDDSIILDLTNFFTKGFSQFFSGHTYEISFERIVGHSTGTLIDGADFHIDCELGEAFMIKNGVLSNLNGYVDLGSDLPKLKSGNNPVEADSTITKLVITPNWWKL